jgi:hypothetical protein
MEPKFHLKKLITNNFTIGYRVNRQNISSPGKSRDSICILVLNKPVFISASKKPSPPAVLSGRDGSCALLFQ